MDSGLEERYLAWLYERIGSTEDTRPSKTYWSLMGYLFMAEFKWFVPNDDNRVEDGRYLRYEFLDDMGLLGTIDPDWLGPGCSVLEMLVALSQRLTFEADRTPAHWFWEMLSNLGLSGYVDRGFDERKVKPVVDALVQRTYDPDGQGGLFPLHNPREDQRNVEIWYQMSQYILEQR